MILYPSFFTKLENTLMTQQFGGWYANFCYLLLVFVLFAGFVDIFAYGFHNSGNLNTDKQINLGMTATQLTFGILICVISILLVSWHISTNNASYAGGIQILMGYNLGPMAQFKTPSNSSGPVVPRVSKFAITLLILAFIYGMIIVIFSADRLLCSTSGSCAITKFTPAEQIALRI